MARRRFVVCYDIASPARWRQVYRIMQGHGEWIQLSVFLCDLDDVERIRLESLLAEVIHHRDDSVCFADLGQELSARKWCNRGPGMVRVHR